MTASDGGGWREKSVRWPVKRTAENWRCQKSANEANGNRPQIPWSLGTNVRRIRPSLCRTNPIPGGRGRDIGRQPMPQAGTQTSAVDSGPGGPNWRGIGRAGLEIVPERTKFSVATCFLTVVSVRWLRPSAAIEPNRKMWHPGKSVELVLTPIGEGNSHPALTEFGLAVVTVPLDCLGCSR